MRSLLLEWGDEIDFFVYVWQKLYYYYCYYQYYFVYCCAGGVSKSPSEQAQ